MYNWRKNEAVIADYNNAITADDGVCKLSICDGTLSGWIV